jgi:hypothetical protein
MGASQFDGSHPSTILFLLPEPLLNVRLYDLFQSLNYLLLKSLKDFLLDISLKALKVTDLDKFLSANLVPHLES